MEPVVYDFAINERGTWADLLTGKDALMPSGYYRFIVPTLLRMDRKELGAPRLAELDQFAAACRTRPESEGMVQTLFDAIFPHGDDGSGSRDTLEALLAKYGFDRAMHEQIREDLKAGRIGLAQNRLPANAVIEDVHETDLTDAPRRFLTNSAISDSPR